MRKKEECEEGGRGGYETGQVKVVLKKARRSKKNRPAKVSQSQGLEQHTRSWKCPKSSKDSPPLKKERARRGSLKVRDFQPGSWPSSGRLDVGGAWMSGIFGRQLGA